MSDGAAIGSTVNILTNQNTETLINQSQFSRSSYKVGQVVGSLPHFIFLPLFYKKKIKQKGTTLITIFFYSFSNEKRKKEKRGKSWSKVMPFCSIPKKG